MNADDHEAGSHTDPTSSRPGPRPAPRARPAGGGVPRRALPPAPEAAVDRQPSPRRWALPVVTLLVGALIGGIGVAAADRRGDDPTTIAAEVGGTSTLPSSAAKASTSITAPTAPLSTAPPPTAQPAPAGRPDATVLTRALGPIPVPSDCTLPLDTPESLPNAARSYRGGVHEGIDFICGVHGRSATTPLPGQVLIANRAFTDPTPADRVEILDTAKATGHTPPWTLSMLFGRFVVIDHGNIGGVGHVVTIYAHLEQIDSKIQPGVHLKTGDPIGEIGNAGTESAGTGEKRPQAIHLHWEIHIDDRFLGDGLSGKETAAVYRELFER